MKPKSHVGMRRALSAKRMPSGGFLLIVPSIPQSILKMPVSLRLALFSDLHLSNNSLAKRLGVTGNRILRLRTMMHKFANDRPSLAKKMVTSPVERKRIARQYYLHGGKWLRKYYGLTVVGARGLITVLAVTGDITRSYAKHVEDYVLMAVQHDVLKGPVSKGVFVKKMAAELRVPRIRVKSIVDASDIFKGGTDAKH